MSWGLLQGLGQGMTDAADTYGDYREQERKDKKAKLKADAALEKMRAKAQRHKENLKVKRDKLDLQRKKHEAGRDPIYAVNPEEGKGLLLGQDQEIPEGFVKTTESVYEDYAGPEELEEQVFYNPKTGKSYTATQKKNPGDLRAKEARLQKSMADSQDDDSPSSSAINRVDKRTSQILGMDDDESYVTGESVEGDPPTQERIDKINQLRQSEGLPPVRLETDTEKKTLLGWDRGWPDKNKWRLVPEGETKTNKKDSTSQKDKDSESAAIDINATAIQIAKIGSESPDKAKASLRQLRKEKGKEAYRKVIEKLRNMRK